MPVQKKKTLYTIRQGFISPILLIALVVVIAVGLAVIYRTPLQKAAESLSSKTSDLPAQTQLASVPGAYSVKGTAKSTTILVKFKPGTSSAAAAAVHAKLGTQVKRNIPDLGVQVVTIPDSTHVADVVQSFKSQREVAYAEPNYVVHHFLTPNDPDYSSEWNLQKISAPAAWDKAQVSAGPVAVIDTGIDSSHPDLSGEVQPGYNFVDSSTNTGDDNGHGTHVAGLIGAITNNTTGIASVGFKASLIPVKVLDSTGSGTEGDVASGITYAVDHGAKVINLSLGGSSGTQTLQDAVTYALNHGVAVVAAAGNNGNNSPVYPAAYPGVIAVSATAQDDSLASFSSYGSDITVSAPGVSILSTYNNGGYQTLSGTSMATPEVSGLLALALSTQSINMTTLLHDLEQTADKVGPYAYNQSGWNQYYGYGRINAGNLLALLTPTAATPTPTATTSPSLSPTASASASPKASATPTNGLFSHGQAPVSFNVDLEGNIDSLDLAHDKLTVKVKTISQNVAVSAGNLVDLYLASTSSLTSEGQPLEAASLAVGEELSIKTLWQNNTLTASSIIAHPTPSTSTSHQPAPAATQPTQPNLNASTHKK